MANKKIVARLDIKNEFVIKGLQLEGLRRVGGIFDIALQREAEKVDEILLIDAVASLYGRQAVVGAIAAATADTLIPITAAGGVKTLDDAKQLFGAGADRVAINSGALQNPNILKEVAGLFGAQSVVLSIEARKVGSDDWRCFFNGGREDSGISVSDWLAQIDPKFVGEIFVTAVDKDGLRRGPDISLLDRIESVTELPVLYSGGIESTKSAFDVLSRDHVSGIAVGAAFHYQSLVPTRLRQELLNLNLKLARREV